MPLFSSNLTRNRYVLSWIRILSIEWRLEASIKLNHHLQGTKSMYIIYSKSRETLSVWIDKWKFEGDLFSEIVATFKINFAHLNRWEDEIIWTKNLYHWIIIKFVRMDNKQWDTITFKYKKNLDLFISWMEGGAGKGPY